jgi:hypothetical protein
MCVPRHIVFNAARNAEGIIQVDAMVREFGQTTVLVPWAKPTPGAARRTGQSAGEWRPMAKVDT